MSATEAKIIREELKKELGLNRTKVGVRSPHYGSLVISIHDPSVDLAEVEKIAKRQESIDRCHASGEILSGGNTFVSVNYSEKAVKTTMAERAADIEAIQKAVAQITEVKSYDVLNVAGFDVCQRGLGWVITKENEVLGQVAWFNPERPSTIAAAILAAA